MEELGFGLFGLAAGWVGAWLQSRRSQPRTPAPKAICTCGHGFGFHDRETRKCNSERLERADGTVAHHLEWRDCRCLFYDGPEPLPEYFAPEIAG